MSAYRVRRSRFPAWPAAVVLAAALGWLVSTALGSSGQGGSTDGEPISGVAPLPIPGAKGPLLQGGELVTLQRAASVAGYPVLIPSDPLASKETLTEVWVHEETKEVGLRFATGVRIFLAKWPNGKDARSSLEAQAKDAHAGRIDTVNGHPTWILPRSAEAPGFPPQTNLTIVLGGVEANIWGDYPAESLLRVASSLAEA